MNLRRRTTLNPQANTLLSGCTITLSGNFNKWNHSQASIAALVKKHSGSITQSVTKTTTHVVCSENPMEASSTKAIAARSKGILCVHPNWIINSDAEGIKLDVGDYVWAASQNNSNTIQTAANGTMQSRRVSRAHGRERDRKKESPPMPRQRKSLSGDVKPKPDKLTKALVERNSRGAVKKESIASSSQFMKNNLQVPLDERCTLPTYVVYIDTQSGTIYDASLNQSNTANNNNRFYRIQVLQDPKGTTFKTWTQWGRVGEGGRNAVLGNGSLDDAKQLFKKKFKDKSGLAWDNRGENPKAGKYAFIERSYDPDSGDDAEAVKNRNRGHVPECTLKKPVKELMQLIFNHHYFDATMSALNYNTKQLPLGKLSRTTITRGFQQLKDLAALLDNPALATDKWGTDMPQATERLSSNFYTLIPHDFGRTQPPIISNVTMLNKELELLESLSGMKEATRIMKLSHKRMGSIHPLDRQFQGLNLEEMTPLDHKSKEFMYLKEYLHRSCGVTHQISYKIREIFRIKRQGEAQRFNESRFAMIPSDRRLLWHGSRCTNFGGILSQGLQIAPPHAPVSGYMFGKGIYLADMSSKSAGYCCPNLSDGHALLLLCEAELGEGIQKLTEANYNAGVDAKRKGMHSTWGQGTTGPSKWVDAGIVHEDLEGIMIPDTKVRPGPTSVRDTSLCYNEYVCYDVAQVKLRYLLHLKM